METCNKYFWKPDQNPVAITCQVLQSRVDPKVSEVVTDLQSAGLRVEEAYIQKTEKDLKLIPERGYLKKLGLRVTQK